MLVDALRAGSTGRIVGHGTVAATTVGNWLRDVMFGHVRQLDRICETMLSRAWAAGAGPGRWNLGRVGDVPPSLAERDCDAALDQAHGAAMGAEAPRIGDRDTAACSLRR